MPAKIHTDKTGWVTVLKDNKNKALMTVAVPGYTFYLVSYSEINSIRFYCETCDKTFLDEVYQCPVCGGV